MNNIHQWPFLFNKLWDCGWSSRCGDTLWGNTISGRNYFAWQIQVSIGLCTVIHNFTILIRHAFLVWSTWARGNYIFVSLNEVIQHLPTLIYSLARRNCTHNWLVMRMLQDSYSTFTLDSSKDKSQFHNLKLPHLMFFSTVSPSTISNTIQKYCLCLFYFHVGDFS